jgi:glutathione synthase/RimK-type ligase-like ATP-grasp enzyme
MIGIVSHASDLHTQEVTRRLDARGAPWRIVDTGAFPARVALTTTQDGDRWRADWAEQGADPLDAADLHAMWWRRPQPFGLHEELRDPQDRGFAVGECAAAVAGLWACTSATWVNDPDVDEAASRKMLQLAVAARLGLRVPRTCMTNDPERARAFVAAEPDGVIFKSFSATPRTWRETRPVREADLALMESVRFAPVIFQELVRGSDIRATVVGDEVFAAEFRSEESAYAFDFRIDTAHCPTSVHRLPDAVHDRLLALMHRLGLWYGAIDLRRTPGGDYVFLEVNPAGQWLFVEYATGQEISDALAGLLTRLDVPVDGRPVDRHTRALPRGAGSASGRDLVGRDRLDPAGDHADGARVRV